MSMYWAEQQLRASGEPQDEAYANMLAAIIEARGDIALPGEENHASRTEQSLVSEEESEWNLSAFTLPESVEPFFLSSRSKLGALSVASEGEKVDTATSMRANIEKLVEPYLLAFGELLPAPQSKEGKQRRKPRNEVVRKAEDLNQEGHLVHYTYRVEYADRNGNVSLRSLKMALGKDRGSYYDMWGDPRPTLLFNFNTRGQATHIELGWVDSSLLLSKLMSTPLREFTTRVFGVSSEGAVEGHYNTRSTIGFHLGSEPTLSIQSPIHDAVYSLRADNTQRLVRTITTDNITKIKNSEVLPAQIAPDEYLGMLYQVLQLVPTISDSELLGHK